jgi:hypothetical protein
MSHGVGFHHDHCGFGHHGFGHHGFGHCGSGHHGFANHLVREGLHDIREGLERGGLFGALEVAQGERELGLGLALGGRGGWFY